MSDALLVTKGMAQIGAWLVASVGGVVAAFRAVVEMWRARIQRVEELRWQQAREAKALLDELEEDPLSRSAMLMLDWSGRKFEVSQGMWVPITTDTMLQALRVNSTTFDETEAYIRDCFDHFFDCLERFEHFVSINLIQFEDLEAGVDYYVDRLCQKPVVYEKFMRTYGYRKAFQFLNRFRSWSSTSKVEVTGVKP